MNELTAIYESMGISPAVYQYGEAAIAKLRERFDAIDQVAEYNQAKVGQTFEVIVDEIDEDGSYIGRTRYDAPEIDNSVIFTSSKELKPGDIVNVMVNDAFDYDLVGMEV